MLRSLTRPRPLLPLRCLSAASAKISARNSCFFKIGGGNFVPSVSIWNQFHAFFVLNPFLELDDNFMHMCYKVMKRGINFTGRSYGFASTIWCLASGYRSSDGLNSVCSYGFYCSASPSSYFSDGAYGLCFGNSNGIDVHPSYDGVYREHGCPVRCLQE